MIYAKNYDYQFQAYSSYRDYIGNMQWILHMERIIKCDAWC